VIIADNKAEYEKLWNAMNGKSVSIKSMMASAESSWQELISLTDPEISHFSSS
jgi:hypothetical protein